MRALLAGLFATVLVLPAAPALAAPAAPEIAAEGPPD